VTTGRQGRADEAGREDNPGGEGAARRGGSMAGRPGRQQAPTAEMSVVMSGAASVAEYFQAQVLRKEAARDGGGRQ